MEEAGQFERIEAQSMHYEVLRQLRSGILSGALTPGGRLNESEIAKQMCISRGPVREAILELAQEGLVQKRYGRGACVVELDPQSFYELADVRIALEGLAIRLAAKHVSPDGLERLKSLIEQMEVAAREGRLERAADYDLEFHRTICQLSANRLLVKTWELLAGRLRLSMALLYERGDALVRLGETHSRVLAAMEVGDGDLATDYLLRDCREAAGEIVSVLAQDRTSGQSG